MTSKERVRRAIEFAGPDRIPCNFDSNRTPDDGIRYGDDFEWVFVDPAPGHRDYRDGLTEWRDEWGVSYASRDGRMGEAVESPLARLGKTKDFAIPDFSASSRYASIELAAKGAGDRYLLGMWPHFLFLTMLDLFGFENLMYRFVDGRDEVEEIAERLTASCIAVVDAMADRGVDGMIAIEDLGVQDRLIISPELWREIFKPRYRRIFARCRERGMQTMMHSCGYIIDLIEDLIEIGLDVIQIDQQDNMGIANLAERYAGRICFFCPVDIQTTLPVGSREAIEAKARELVVAFGSPNGGFMAKTYPQPEAIAIPERSHASMCEAFRRYGTYL